MSEERAVGWNRGFLFYVFSTDATSLSSFLDRPFRKLVIQSTDLSRISWLEMGCAGAFAGFCAGFFGIVVTATPIVSGFVAMDGILQGALTA